MMVGTLITEENADSFMPAVGDYALITLKSLNVYSNQHS